MFLSKGDLVFVKWGRYSSGPFPFDDFILLRFHEALLDINQLGEIARSSVYFKDNKPYYIVKVGETYYRCLDKDLEPMFCI